jgi:uncharacterized membrane protein HdeD (DUF308 family)
MTRWNQSSRITFIAIHGFTLIVLGCAVLYLRATMTNALFAVLGSALALLLVAAALVFLNSLDWICAIGSSYRQINPLRWLLLVGTVAAICAVFLVFYSETTTAHFCKLLGFYAGCLALGKFQLARSWKGGHGEQKTIYLLSTLSVIFSVALVLLSPREERFATALVGAYCIFVGAQLLITLDLLRTRAMTSEVSEDCSVNKAVR